MDYKHLDWKVPAVCGPAPEATQRPGFGLEEESVKNGEIISFYNKKKQKQKQ